MVDLLDDTEVINIFNIVEKDVNHLLDKYDYLSIKLSTKTTRSDVDDYEIFSFAQYIINLYRKVKDKKVISGIEIDREDLKNAIELMQNKCNIHDVIIGIDSFFAIMHSYPFIVDIMMSNIGVDYWSTDYSLLFSEKLGQLNDKVKNRLNDIRTRRHLQMLPYWSNFGYVSWKLKEKMGVDAKDLIIHMKKEGMTFDDTYESIVREIFDDNMSREDIASLVRRYWNLSEKCDVINGEGK